MGFKNSMKELAGQGQEANKIIGESFSNLEDKMLTVQENQVEFEKYLKDILKIVKGLENGKKEKN